jgi:hypothetical protein
MREDWKEWNFQDWKILATTVEEIERNLIQRG